MDKLTAMMAAVLVAGVGVVGWQFLQPDGDGNGQAETAPDTGRKAEGAPIVRVTLPEGLSENARHGKTIFDAQCATCHGENAAGKDGRAPPLVHKIYEPGHHSDQAFILAARNGVRAHHWRFGNMPPVEGVTQGDIKMVTAYIRELQRANGIN